MGKVPLSAIDVLQVSPASRNFVVGFIRLNFFFYVRRLKFIGQHFVCGTGAQ